MNTRTPRGAKSDVVRVSFTLSPDDVEQLAAIVEARHPKQYRADSMTVRELIREEYARIQQPRRKQHEEGQANG